MAVPPRGPGRRRPYGYHRGSYAILPGCFAMLLVAMLAYWLFSLLVPALAVW